MSDTCWPAYELALLSARDIVHEHLADLTEASLSAASRADLEPPMMAIRLGLAYKASWTLLSER